MKRKRLRSMNKCKDLSVYSSLRGRGMRTKQSHELELCYSYFASSALHPSWDCFTAAHNDDQLLTSSTKGTSEDARASKYRGHLCSIIIKNHNLHKN